MTLVLKRQKPISDRKDDVSGIEDTPLKTEEMGHDMKEVTVSTSQLGPN